MNLNSFTVNGYAKTISKIPVHKVDFFKNFSKKENYVDFLRFLKKSLEDWDDKTNQEKISLIIEKFSITNQEEINEVKYFFKISNLERSSFLNQINWNLLQASDNISNLKTSVIWRLWDIIKTSFWWIWKSLWVEDLWWRISFEWLSFEKNFSEISENIFTIQRKIFQISSFIINENQEKDKKITDLTSKNIFLEWKLNSEHKKNFTLDDQNFSLKEDNYRLNKENILLDKKIFSAEEKIFNLEKSKVNIKKSRREIIKEKQELERRLLESENQKWFFKKTFSNIFWENKRLKKEIEKINLIIKEKDDKLLSFENQIKELESKLEEKLEEIGNLQNSLQEEKDENKRLWDENDEIREERDDLKLEKERLISENLELNNAKLKIEEELNWINAIIKNISENKIKKEEILNKNVEKIQSLKDRMRDRIKNKLKK